MLDYRGGRQLILASRSPQRVRLLAEAGFNFRTEPADIDEENYPSNLLPSDVVLHLAKGKADAIVPRFPDDVVLAADTVVAFGDLILGKPKDASDATAMIRTLAGTTHLVITGVAVQCKLTGFSRSTRVMSAVRMRPLSAQQIAKYVATNDWQGKAGGYGIQNIDKHADLAAGDPFIQRTAGCETNIIGLPMSVVKNLLEAAGIFPKA